MRLTNDCINTFISVPNIFIDNYMSKASGEFVKVYREGWNPQRCCAPDAEARL